MRAARRRGEYVAVVCACGCNAHSDCPVCLSCHVHSHAHESINYWSLVLIEVMGMEGCSRCALRGRGDKGEPLFSPSSHLSSFTFLETEKMNMQSTHTYRHACMHTRRHTHVLMTNTCHTSHMMTTYKTHVTRHVRHVYAWV